MTPEALYLDLLKKSLTYYIWGEALAPVPRVSRRPFVRGMLLRGAAAIADRYGMQLARRPEFDPAKREEGLDWPSSAHTMIGLRRLDNLQACIEDVIRQDVPGDLIETGVWRGGATIFMRAVLQVYGVRDRTVWVADSFAGLPPPDAAAYPADEGSPLHRIPFLRVSLEDVQANFARYGLLDDQVKFLKGWFRDTLPTAPVEKIAVLRLDGDLYESTMDALVNLYDRVAPGGYVIVDDYFDAACRQAVHDFRARHGITDAIRPIDRQSIFWQREPAHTAARAPRTARATPRLTLASAAARAD